MKPISKPSRQVLGQDVPTYSMSGGDEDFTFEGGENAFLNDEQSSQPVVDGEQITDEEIKLDALEQAINGAKLMAEVSPLDVITIAGKFADFLKNYNPSEK